MGRPLKIQKYGTNQGAGAPGAAVAVDQAFPPFSALTAPVYPTGGTYPVWEGVVGGTQGGAVSATYPVIQCQMNIALPDGSGQGVENGVILRQKGSHKYLVMSSGQNVEDEEMVVGASYYIASLDTTNWQQMGAPAGAIVGTIFTCTALCADPQNGYGYLVGQCVLSNDTTPPAGYMAVSYSIGDSTAVPVSKLTNKFMLNWDNFQNAAGTSLTSYASGGDNSGTVVYTGEGRVASNFFTDEGTVEKSGAEAATCTGGVSTLTLGIVESYTS